MLNYTTELEMHIHLLVTKLDLYHSLVIQYEMYSVDTIREEIEITALNLVKVIQREYPTLADSSFRSSKWIQLKYIVSLTKQLQSNYSDIVYREREDALMGLVELYN